MPAPCLASGAGRNRRVLLVDDDPLLHLDFRRILAGAEADGFELVSALQGHDGLRELRHAVSEERPFAVAFLDMHMPPGWDGLRTARELWACDPRLQVVLCTAHAGDDWDAQLPPAPDRDRLLVLKKPFEIVEVLQLARTLAAKWDVERDAALRQQELRAFAHSVAHDLRSPLARVNAYGALLAEVRGTDEGRATHYLRRMRANAAHGEALVEGLLQLADIAQAALHPEVVDISALARSVVANLQSAAPERSVQVRIAAGLRAWGDVRLLRLAVMHLIENAWKFTSRRRQACIELSAAQGDDGYTTFVLRDDGCGFDMAYAGPLFQRIHRLHDAGEHEGTGVGLVVVARVLARHGGGIHAESAPDAGAVFRFTLPRVPAHATVAATAELSCT